MKALVLAAGEGRRLRPLTDKTPKALMDVGGVPMLEFVIRRLVAAGVDGVIVNAFHLAEQVEAFLKSHDLGVPVSVSRESVLLDTGGGLKQAAPFFDDGRPFFVHNADVYSELDLRAMYNAHVESGALATLAVCDRPTQRHLLFDGQGRLCGRQSLKGGLTWAAAPVDRPTRLAFNGIHVVSPELLGRLCETGAFPIMDAYLRLAGEGADIRAFRMDDRYYNDIGDMGKLAEVRRRALRPPSL